MTLRLPAALVQWFRGVPAPVETLAPAPEWDRELQKLRGLTEIHRCTAENVVFYDFVKTRRER